MEGGFIMNQIKIGAFISDCRKAKGWTQNQLGKNWELQIKPYQNRKQEFPKVKDTTPNITTPRLYGT